MLLGVDLYACLFSKNHTFLYESHYRRCTKSTPCEIGQAGHGITAKNVRQEHICINQ